jgi:hypothetical protein
METAVSKKSGRGGKGGSDGLVTELATFWDVLPGRGEEARAGGQRMIEAVHGLDPAVSASTGLRDARIVVFDDGRRLLFATTFESEWDPYIDDAVLIVGIAAFLDWAQHTVQGQEIMEWAKESGADKFAVGDPEWEQTMRKASSVLKRILQSIQVPAAGYYNAVSTLTLPQIDRGQRVEQAFQQVLDDPAAAEALQHPALKPLLELAAD